MLSPYANVINETDQPIEVYNVVDGDEVLVVSLDIPAGGSQAQQLFHTGFTYPGGMLRGCSR